MKEERLFDSFWMEQAKLFESGLFQLSYREVQEELKLFAEEADSSSQEVLDD